MACGDFPDKKTGETLLKDATTINEIVTSPDDLTNPASDGKQKETLVGLSKKFGVVIVGDYVDGTVLTNIYDGAGLTSNGTYWAPVNYSDLPITIDATTYPNPEDHVPAIRLYGDVNSSNISTYTNLEFGSVADMISYANHAAGYKYSTGATSWVVVTTEGIPLGGGLFAKPLNGLWLNDWGVDETGSVNCDDAMEQMLTQAELIGAKCKAYGQGAIYLITRQQTVRHGTGLDFQGAQVKFEQSTSNNDSPFQMGNNTELKNISKVTYSSVSASSFSTTGIVKIGEFYAQFNGAPTAGENSLDPSYWEVKNVNVENVAGSSENITNYTDRTYGAVVYIVGGTNVTTRSIHNNGLAADGEKVTIMSTVRTEPGYDVNNRRQGYNLHLVNTTGENLEASPETAVCYISGDRNTKVDNVYGLNCGQIFSCNTSGNSSNQSPELLGKNGINIKADNIIGEGCSRRTGSTFSKLTAGVNLKADAPDDNSQNRFIVKVSNISIVGVASNDDQLAYAVALGDNLGSNIDNSRIRVEGVEGSKCGKGLLIDSPCKLCVVSDGRFFENWTNGAEFRGDDNQLVRVKIYNNNLKGETNADSFNAHGVNYGGNRCVMDSCEFGDQSVAVGSETQLTSVSVTENGANGIMKNCKIFNYKSGFADVYSKSGVSGDFIEIDKNTKGVRNISTPYPIAPGIAAAELTATGAGVAQYAFSCSISPVNAGRYRVSFDKTMPDANYTIVATAEGGTANDITVDYSSKSTTSFDIYTKENGSELNRNFSVVVNGNNASIF